MELGNMVYGNARGKFEVNRDWQKAFVEQLYWMGFDSYGVPLDSMYDELYDNTLKKTVKANLEYEDDFYRYENDTFIIMPYYWGDDGDILKLPNFVYKPTGFELSWYKYALRDSYMNQDVSKKELLAMLRQCEKSVNDEKKQRIDKYNKWYESIDDETKMLQQAIYIANEHHFGQVDKAGMPYILHPLHVMDEMETIEEKIVAVLHDIVEDTSITLDDLYLVGFSNAVIRSITAITRRENESYNQYIDRLKADETARKVKKEDILHNKDITRLPFPEEADYKRVEKYEKTLKRLEKIKQESGKK